MSEKYVIAYDTLCDGWQCHKDLDGSPTFYDTPEEAQAEIDYEFSVLQQEQIASGAEPDEETDEFVVPWSEFIPNRKAIFIYHGQD